MKTTLMFAGLSAALALSVALARPALANSETNRPTTSTTCYPTTTTRQVTTSTTNPPSTTTSQPSSTTSVESSTTTTTAPVTTTTFVSTTTAPSAPTTVTTIESTTSTTTPVETTVPTEIIDAVTLTPTPTFGATGEITELPATGFAYGWVIGGATFALLLGSYLLAVYRRWTT